MLMIPTMIIIAAMLSGLSFYTQHVIENQHLNQSEPLKAKGLIAVLGTKLRDAKVPFSQSTDLLRSAGNAAPLVTRLIEVRTGIIYVWAALFMIGFAVYFWVAIKLQAPYINLNRAIKLLEEDNLAEPIDIEGFKNIRDMFLSLEQLRLRLRQNQTQQTQVLRHISHEIKTPLTSIKEGSRLLSDEVIGAVNFEQREIIDILNKSSDELQQAIENLLNYNSATSVKQVRTRQTIDFSELIYDALSKHALPIKQKDISLVQNIETASVFVDRQQMLAVIENLVSNAIKFSPLGGTIYLDLEASDDTVAFTIRDQGAGVSADQKDAIFNAFFVGNQITNSPVKGTGLGLSIAKQYVELHQGALELIPTREGAAFRVSLKV